MKLLINDSSMVFNGDDKKLYGYTYQVYEVGYELGKKPITIQFGQKIELVDRVLFVYALNGSIDYAFGLDQWSKVEKLESVEVQYSVNHKTYVAVKQTK